jgi:hypothetical protein
VPLLPSRHELASHVGEPQNERAARGRAALRGRTGEDLGRHVFGIPGRSPFPRAGELCAEVEAADLSDAA